MVNCLRSLSERNGDPALREMREFHKMAKKAEYP